MGLFLGTHINKVDQKGRVSVPSQFRDVLKAESFHGIILYPSLVHEGALEGCSMTFLEQLANASAQQLDVFSEEQDDLATAIYASSVQLPWDEPGRVVLPDHIISHANIDGQVAFVGRGKSFQLWHPDAYRLREQQAKQRLMQNRPSVILKRPEGA